MTDLQQKVRPSEDKNAEKVTTKRPWHRGIGAIFHFSSTEERWLVALGLLLNVLNGLTLPLFILAFGGLFNSLGAPSPDDKHFNYYVKIQLYLGVAAFLLSGIGSALIELAAEKQLRRIRRAYLTAALCRDISWYDAHDAGTLGSRLNQDCVEIRDGTGLKLGQAVQLISMFLGGYGVGFYRSWNMTLVLSAALPIIAVCGALMVKAVSSSSHRSKHAYSQAGSIAEEVLGAIRTVVAFGAEKISSQRYNAHLDNCMKESFKGGVGSGAGMGGTLGVLFCFFALGFWYGAKLIADSLKNNCIEESIITGTQKCFRGGDALTAFFAVLIAAFSLGQAGPPLTAFFKAGAAAQDIREFIETPSAVDPWNPAGVKDIPLKGEIIFKNVVFAYPSRKELPVYNKLNLHIPAGQTVALVGVSGCGKSTATQLLQRFYDVEDGQITLDGVDLREFNVGWLRDQMSLVSQEPRLFARSIAENIRDGRLSATDEEVEAAAASANALDFIRKFPNGLHTFVGEAGSQLSGGQKQRIAIARAMLRNPAILILDEATSALDNESEKIVQRTLDELLAGRKRTTIMIAHRLSTVRNADKIIVLANPNNEGSVVIEEGSHNELMDRPNGVYRNMVLAQGLETESHKKRCASFDTTSREISGAFSEIASPLQKERESLPPADDDSEVTAIQREISRFLSKKISKLTSQNASRAEASRDLTDIVVKGTEIFEENLKPPSYVRVLSLLKPHWKEVGIGLLGSAAAGCVFPLYSLLLGDFMGIYFYTDADSMLSLASKKSLWFVGLAAMVFFSVTIQRMFMEWAGHRLVRILRAKAFEELLYQDIAFFDDPQHSTGALADTLSGDTLLMKGWAGDNLGVAIQNIATLIAALIVSFTAHVTLAAVSLACFVAIMPASMIAAKVEMGTTKDAEGDAKCAGHVISEAVINIRVISAYNLQRRVLEVYDVVLESDYITGRKQALLGGFLYGLSLFFQFACQATSLWYGGLLMEQGKITDAGTMMRATSAMMTAAMGIGQAMIFATDIGKAKAAGARIFHIIDRVPQIDTRSPDGIICTNEDIKGAVAVENLRFRYPRRPESLIFRGISFKIQPGETVALVGASGCGKSTIIQLLERFYDPGTTKSGAGGGLSIDGHDLRDLQVQSLRQLIGLVGQEPILFDSTIADNIRYGKPDATDEEVERAARMANAHSFIVEFPNGYQTSVGKLGSQLSGGQKQRIAIARAMIRDPKILLLDEATSALDSESEKQVQAALDELMQQASRTTIVIAHRLSTVRKADRIIVLANPDNEGAEIVESGTHEQLMALPNGVYRGLVNVAIAAGEK